MTDKPRILLVTHQFTPRVSPRTTRWSILCEELIERGYEVTVVTGTKQDEKDSNKYRVLYFGSEKLGSVIENTRRASSSSEKNNEAKRFFFYILKKVYRFLYRTFAWPDYSMFWFFSIRRRRKAIPDYDLIISVSLPFTSHLVAYSINKKIGKKWIMDIGDPFYLKKDAPENNKYIFSFLNKHFENKFYQSANNVVFTHDESMKYHYNSFPVLDGKSTVLPPVFDANEIDLNNNFEFSKRPLKIAYFGVLTIGIRTPDNFLAFFDKLQLDEVELHWYVNEDTKQMVKNRSSTNINNVFHDMVPRSDAISLMVNEYHALLNIGNANSFQLPSKVIEYISTGKPIVHFSEINNDSAESILKARSNAIIISENSDLNYVKKEINDKLFSDTDMTSVDKYSSRSVTDELVKLI